MDNKVLVFGAFDGLHPGHLDFFNQAKYLADYLMVSVAIDDVVFEYKHKWPMFDQNKRLDLVENCEYVDKALLGPPDNYYQYIKKISPDMICLGYDQWPKEKDVMKQLKEVQLFNTKVIRLKPYKEKVAKSSLVKENFQHINYVNFF